MAKKKTKPKSPPPPPKCKAILLCERTIIEVGTGNVSIISVVDHFTVPTIPGTLRPFTVYMHLTDGVEGHEYEFTVELRDLSNDTVMAKGPGYRLRWGETLSRLNLLFPVPPLPVAHAGTYDLVVMANQQEIDRQKFGVMIPPAPTANKEEEGNG